MDVTCTECGVTQQLNDSADDRTNWTETIDEKKQLIVVLHWKCGEPECAAPNVITEPVEEASE